MRSNGLARNSPRPPSDWMDNGLKRTVASLATGWSSEKIPRRRWPEEMVRKFSGEKTGTWLLYFSFRGRVRVKAIRQG
jgi:hypothetical protein